MKPLRKREHNMPKFTRQHIIWVLIALVIALYIFLPTSGVVNILRPIFHVVFSQMLSWFG